MRHTHAFLTSYRKGGGKLQSPPSQCFTCIDVLQEFTPEDEKKSVRYGRYHTVPTYDGDVYVFPGCAIEHAIGNPSLSTKQSSKTKYGIAR
jgi:hypothetical protein